MLYFKLFRYFLRSKNSIQIMLSYLHTVHIDSSDKAPPFRQGKLICLYYTDSMFQAESMYFGYRIYHQPFASCV